MSGDEKSAERRPDEKSQPVDDGSRRADKAEVADEITPESAPKEQPGDAAEPGEGPDRPSAEKVTTGGDPTEVSDAEDEELPEPVGPQLPPAHPSKRGMFGVHGSGDTSGYGGLVPRDTNPVRGASTPRPWDPAIERLGDDIGAALQKAGIAYDDAVEKVVVDRGEVTFFIHRERLPEVAKTFRDDPTLRFEMCMGVSGVHYPDDVGRELHAMYPLLSITHNRRVRLEVVAPDDDPHIPSVVATYPSNNWHERETYDFFGIIFDGHPALTRIEMPDDWVGHPQRKDYPLGGIPVEYKGATIPPPDDRRAYN